MIVMMTALVEDGEKQCDRYWPDEGSSLYHIYEACVFMFVLGVDFFPLSCRLTVDVTSRTGKPGVGAHLVQ